MKCERADLSVNVISPADAPAAFSFKVRVRNRGPQAASYSLLVDEDNQHSDCGGPWEGVNQKFGELAPGATRTRTLEMECVIEGEDPWVEITAEVFSHGVDRRPGNSRDSAVTDLPSG